MNKHTPAPWIITNGRCIYGSGDFVKPFVASVEDDHNDGETEANARLIASAPDLLEALRECLTLLNDPDAEGSDALRVERQIIAAINKATGDAQ